MGGITQNTADQQPLTEIREFQNQILTLLRQYQSNRLVDAKTKEYQENLERILKETQDILQSGKITRRESKQLDALLDSSEEQYEAMKQANSSDKEFKSQFVKVFGTQSLSGSVAKATVEAVGQSMLQFQKTIAQTAAPLMKNVKDTALFELTGPFGALAQQSINFGAIKDALTSHRANNASIRQSKTSRIEEEYASPEGRLNASIKGAFAGGVTSVPDQGSYFLHKGERVVPPTQNEDLSNFLRDVQNSKNSEGQGTSDRMMAGVLQDIDKNVAQANKLLNVEIASGYFDPVVENQDKLFIMAQRDKIRFNQRLFKTLETMELGIFNVGQTMYGGIIKMVLGVQRFSRHAFFYSVDYMLQPLISGAKKAWSNVFGKKESGEEKIYDRLGDIYNLVDKGIVHRGKRGRGGAPAHEEEEPTWGTEVAFEKLIRRFLNVGWIHKRHDIPSEIPETISSKVPGWMGGGKKWPRWLGGGAHIPGVNVGAKTSVAEFLEDTFGVRLHSSHAKKRRRRNPATGRFEKGYVESGMETGTVEASENVSKSAWASHTLNLNNKQFKKAQNTREQMLKQEKKQHKGIMGIMGMMLGGVLGLAGWFIGGTAALAFGYAIGHVFEKILFGGDKKTPQQQEAANNFQKLFYYLDKVLAFFGDKAAKARVAGYEGPQNTLGNILDQVTSSQANKNLSFGAYADANKAHTLRTMASGPLGIFPLHQDWENAQNMSGATLSSEAGFAKFLSMQAKPNSQIIGRLQDLVNGQTNGVYDNNMATKLLKGLEKESGFNPATFLAKNSMKTAPIKSESEETLVGAVEGKAEKSLAYLSEMSNHLKVIAKNSAGAITTLPPSHDNTATVVRGVPAGN